MAETREVVVTIRSQSLGGGQPAGSPASSNATQGPQAPEVGEGNSVSTEAQTKSQAMTTIAVQLAEKTLADIAGIAISEIDYRIQRGFYLKDDYIGQRNYQIAKAQVMAVASTAAMVGANMVAYGPIAGSIKSVIDIGMRVGKNVQAYQHANEEQNYQIKQLDANLRFNRTRAGYSLTSGSIGENR